MEDLVGDWKVASRGDNFDDFLQCRHVKWWLRTLMTKITPKLPHHINFTLDPDTLTKSTLTTLGPVSHTYHTHPMPLHSYFVPARTLSGEVEVGRVVETSTRKVVVEMRYEESDEVASVVEHQVFGDELFVKMKCGQIVYEETYERMKS